MDRPVFPVILSGGAGSRLWPLSREHYPKQLIALADEHTMLQATARRLSALESPRAPIVVCNEEHRFMVAEQLRAAGVAPEAIVLEPVGRSTAPAVAAAALEALARRGEGEEPVLLVLPADHVIRDEARFAGALRDALREAAAGRLVTFGVAPTGPETGYGYIHAASPTGTGTGAWVVDRFVEKPDAGHAAAWIEAGGWYWNSGMFVFGAARYLRELDAHAPGLHAAVGAAHEKAARDRGFLRLHAGSFAAAPALSVDHAIMEHTSDAVVVPLDAGWSDVGSWTALSELAEEDAEGNVARGDVVLEGGTRGTYVHGGERLVAVVGVADCVIVDTADALLVAGRNAAQGVKGVVTRLRNAGREEHRSHRKVYRPWGSYDSVHHGEGFKVKHITVNPGQRLSLQMHHHRAEHWIVVRGAARVTRDDQTFMVLENQSTYIPRGARHRLENPGDAPLQLIEVQTGAYLGEDDIVRFEDAYGRAAPEGSRAGDAGAAPGAAGRKDRVKTGSDDRADEDACGRAAPESSRAGDAGAAPGGGPEGPGEDGFR